MPTPTISAFLTELLAARSPSGYEMEAQAVFDRHVQPAADAHNDLLLVIDIAGKQQDQQGKGKNDHGEDEWHSDQPVNR